MPTDKERTERLKWEQKAYDAGEGMYFRNGGNVLLRVEVSFYPKLARFITENGERRKITAEELAWDYHRLPL